MNISFFGSSLVSSYWNGAATYYRGIIRALNELGHRITFYEPDAWQRQQHRDMADPEWAQVVVYPAEPDSVLRALESAHNSDLIIKASGVGVFDDLLEEAVLDLKTAANSIVFWDVDAAATLDRVLENQADHFHSLISRFDSIFTYGGGRPVLDAYLSLGARECIPIYNALDQRTHYPVQPESRYQGDLAFLGNRLPDRESRVDEFFFRPAECLPGLRFVLGGAGWSDKLMPSNVQYCDHVYTADHNAFNSTPRVVLNVTRESMAKYGFSPATRVFEAAGAAACLMTDRWDGIEHFFEPEAEIIVANDAEDVIRQVSMLSASEAYTVGQKALRRVLAEHTYAHRALQIDKLLNGSATCLVSGLR